MKVDVGKEGGWVQVDGCESESLPLIALLHIYPVVGILKVNFREAFGTGKVVHQLPDKWQGVAVLHSNRFEPSVVYIEA